MIVLLLDLGFLRVSQVEWAMTLGVMLWLPWTVSYHLVLVNRAAEAYRTTGDSLIHNQEGWI